MFSKPEDRVGSAVLCARASYRWVIFAHRRQYSASQMLRLESPLLTCHRQWGTLRPDGSQHSPSAHHAAPLPARGASHHNRMTYEVTELETQKPLDHMLSFFFFFFCLAGEFDRGIMMKTCNTWWLIACLAVITHGDLFYINIWKTCLSLTD